MEITRLISLCTFCILLASCTAIANEPYPEIKSIYWSDADSGRINGTFKFRIANMDAPETRSMKQRGGAKCESERVLGYQAKAWAVSVTEGAQMAIQKDYGLDRYDRYVIDLTVNGRDYGGIGAKAGTLKEWPHKNGRALREKPDWCLGGKG